MPNIWHDANILLLNNKEVTFPSITDHVWILMRTDVVQRPFLPRLCDAIEIFLILKKNYSFDSDILNKRAKQEIVPAIVRGMSYACSRYMGINPLLRTYDGNC